jgi:hypothetical protein
MVSRACSGEPLLVVVTEIGKSRAQERKYHRLIAEFSKQIQFDLPRLATGKVVQIPKKRRYSPDTWKALLVDAFEQEKALMGEPLRKPGRVVPSLDGQRVVSLRASTRDFSRVEGSEFIEFLYARGVEYGVQWPAEQWQIIQAERGAA